MKHALVPISAEDLKYFENHPNEHVLKLLGTRIVLGTHHIGGGKEPPTKKARGLGMPLLVLPLLLLPLLVLPPPHMLPPHMLRRTRTSQCPPARPPV